MSKVLNGLAPVCIKSLALVFLLVVGVASAADKPKTPIDKGKVLAMKLCQACHVFQGAQQAGTVGPPFASMKIRFPDRKKLRDIIYDAQASNNPDTMMPPFGRHGFVNEDDIRNIIDFLYRQ